MAITTNVGKILMMPKGQWLNNVTYYYLDLVTYNGTKWLCKKESCIGMEPSNGSEYWYPWDEADVGGSVVDFTVATTRTDIQPGETIAILFGKIKKWLIDLKTVAFTGKMEDMVELTKASTTELGCVKVDGDTITVDENGVIKGNSKVTVDNQLSTTSENPVMNRVITAKINELEEEIGSGDAIIAENYSATTSYVANDEVIYNGELWRCKLACVGTTPAEGTYWTKTTVGNELKTINSDLSECLKISLYTFTTKPTTQTATSNYYSQTSIATELAKYENVLGVIPVAIQININHFCEVRMVNATAVGVTTTYSTNVTVNCFIIHS